MEVTLVLRRMLCCVRGSTPSLLRPLHQRSHTPTADPPVPLRPLLTLLFLLALLPLLSLLPLLTLLPLLPLCPPPHPIPLHRWWWWWWLRHH
jgi:hypothetical protein